MSIYRRLFYVSVCVLVVFPYFSVSSQTLVELNIMGFESERDDESGEDVRYGMNLVDKG
jgi:hypothetical protein